MQEGSPVDAGIDLVMPLANALGLAGVVWCPENSKFATALRICQAGKAVAFSSMETYG